MTAAGLLAETPLTDTKSGAARSLNEVIDQTAGRLGNTRSVCRKSYIHPRVVDSWLEGTLAAEMETVRKKSSRTGRRTGP